MLVQCVAGDAAVRFTTKRGVSGLCVPTFLMIKIFLISTDQLTPVLEATRRI